MIHLIKRDDAEEAYKRKPFPTRVERLHTPNGILENQRTHQQTATNSQCLEYREMVRHRRKLCTKHLQPAKRLRPMNRQHRVIYVCHRTKHRHRIV